MSRRPSEVFPFSHVSGDFSPAGAGKSGAGEVGPNANRGQKGRVSGFAVGIDYLTLVFPRSRLEECGVLQWTALGEFICGGAALIRVGLPTGRGLYRYENSCYVVDREGTLVGRVAFGGNNDTVLFELSGEGCRWIKSWAHVRFQAECLAARISRCDVALDDFGGIMFDLRELAQRAADGLFKSNGRPPKTRFLDDHGNNTGCTLYVGKKGHKELCVYEKGKAFKDESSPWVRIEQRFYSKHVGDEQDGVVLRSLSMDILTYPLRFFRGAHAYLDELCSAFGLQDIAVKMKIVKAKVEATAVAAVKWLRTQCGQTLHVLHDALGDDADVFLRTQIAREGRPTRFKSLGADTLLFQFVRQQLCPVSM